MYCCGGEADKFTEKFRNKLLKDLAANYAQVQRCYCEHKDRIQSVQENLKYYKRMAYLQTVLIFMASIILLFLAFLAVLGAGICLSQSQYGRGPCVTTLPFWNRDDCEVLF